MSLCVKQLPDISQAVVK